MNGFIFFSSGFTVTTRKQILNLCVLIFLETQETGVTPKWQRIAGYSVSDGHLKFTEQGGSVAGYGTCSSEGRSIPNTGNARETWIMPVQGWCFAEVPLAPMGQPLTQCHVQSVCLPFLIVAWNMHVISCVLIECLAAWLNALLRLASWTMTSVTHVLSGNQWWGGRLERRQWADIPGRISFYLPSWLCLPVLGIVPGGPQWAANEITQDNGQVRSHGSRPLPKRFLKLLDDEQQGLVENFSFGPTWLCLSFVTVWL